MPKNKTNPNPQAPAPSIDEFADLCAALDASGRACNAKTKEDSRWCPHHDEERIKLYINYKAHHTALNAFPEHSICHSVGAIKGCTSLETIRAWNKTLLQKYQLLNRCNLLWEKLRTRLARYCAPAKSKFYNERIAIIHACVRRAIYTDTKLLVVAQNYKNVMALLTDNTLDVQIVEKLWNAIRLLYVYEVRAAIDDVLRPKDGPGEYVTVLGGRVYKDPSGISFPFHAWGHITALFQCYSCVRRVCTTVDEVVTLTRFVVLNMNGLSQSNLKYDIPYDGSKVLSLCGFIPNSVDTFPPRSVVSKCNCVYNGVPHWEETAVSYVLCAGLPLTDPQSSVFVNACLRDPSLMVIVRKGAAGCIIKSVERVWAERMRHANTRAGLKTAEWDPARAVYYQDSVLEEACPRVYDTKVLEDCFQVVLVDGGQGTMADFVKKISDIWLDKVYKVADTIQLITEIAIPIVKSGELEIDYGKRGPALVMANLETDVLKAYKRLWGRAPVELVDDDIFQRIPGPIPGPKK
ncbi:FAD-binding-3 domain-containing protein [Mycena sanguinolenta]|uniref:FAD-binding-3 domain-containing protein n=1 Tax=Mycena sanguinolenta TaxID=230812 RepID=A0A8H7DB58_9AGAR|nr:FAD-binding-3 domain-containing protein [Mycena sanguinolenta]